MAEFKDPLQERYREIQILEEARKEGREIIYDIYSANEETVRICRENEKKKPRPIPDDHRAYFKKVMGIRD